jgi:RecA/RadA recombinase
MSYPKLIDKLVGIRTTLDVLCLTSNELARRLQVPDAHHITEKVAKALAPSPQLIGGPSYKDTRERISTGDANFDSLIGGGIVTGAVWEIVGERSAQPFHRFGNPIDLNSSTGKTQLALQMALMAMVSPSNAKFEYSTCYLSDRTSFPTERLIQMLHSRSSRSLATATESMLELLSFRHLASSDDLMQLLKLGFSQLAEQKIAADTPLKLLVIDALAPLVAFDGHATPALLRGRAQKLSDIGFLLLSLARKYNFAALVVNEVYDVFTPEQRKRNSSSQLRNMRTSWKLPTWDGQADWFARTPQRLVNSGAVDPNGRKEAKLGLGWAYRVHARIMLTRTNRKWTLPDTRISTNSGSDLINTSIVRDTALGPAPAKKRRLDTPALGLVYAQSDTPAPLQYAATENSPTSPVTPVPISLRDLTVLFSKFGPRASIDFVIRTGGIETIEGTSNIEHVKPQIISCHNLPSGKFELQRDRAFPEVLLPKAEPPIPLQLIQATTPSSLADHASAADPERRSTTNYQVEITEYSRNEPIVLPPKPDSDPAKNDVDWEFYFPDIYGQNNNGVGAFELDLDDAALEDGDALDGIRPPSPASSQVETEVDEGETDGKMNPYEASRALGRAASLTSARSLPR